MQHVLTCCLRFDLAKVIATGYAWLECACQPLSLEWFWLNILMKDNEHKTAFRGPSMQIKNKTLLFHYTVCGKQCKQQSNSGSETGVTQIGLCATACLWIMTHCRKEANVCYARLCGQSVPRCWEIWRVFPTRDAKDATLDVLFRVMGQTVAPKAFRHIIAEYV